MSLLGSWQTWFPISERNYFGANIWRPGADHRRHRAAARASRSTGGARSGPVDAGPRLRSRRLHRRATTPSRPARSAAGCARARRRCSTPRCGRACRWAPARITSTTSAATRSGSTPPSRSRGGGRQTMSFTNDTKGTDRHPRLPRIRSGGVGWVRYEIWGIPDGRTVRLSRAVRLERPRGDDDDRHGRHPADGRQGTDRVPVERDGRRR